METEKSEKDLIVDVGSKEVQIALMENHRLIELNKESSQGHTFSIGDVFLGRVKKVMPALNAAFVDMETPRKHSSTTWISDSSSTRSTSS